MIQELWAQIGSATKPLTAVLHRCSDSKVIVIGLRSSVLLKEHVSPVAARLMVLQGEVEYRQGDEIYTLQPYQQQNIPAQTLRLQDTLCLLIQG
ncbi:MAG: hypothetical protein IPL35_01000 [Sphingobacteriales bacterium]|nr:hypothetical protein [Sphingobacteriales bacterium]